MIKQFRLIFFISKIFVLFTSVLFLSPSTSAALDTPSPSKRVNQDIIRGIELLYNWDFEEAENIFLKVTAEKRKDPSGYFYLAMVTWSRMASGFWGPETVREYGKRIDRTIDVAKKKIESGTADSFTYFYLGGALGFKARFQLMRQQWLYSYLLAGEAINALNTCLRMDPGNKDVLLGLGIFDYYTATLSGVLKFLTYIFLHKGDKQEGLKKLHIAANEAVYSSIEAKSLLLHIYLFVEEEYFQEALTLAEELSQRFKKNPRNKFLQGIAYIRMDRDNMYREIVQYLKSRGHSETSGQKALIWTNRALYLEASYYLFNDHYERARSRLDAILSQTDPATDPIMVAWPILKQGMSYDLGGNRDRALTYYNKVLGMKNGAGAQFLAEKLIDERPQKRDPFIGY